MLLCAGIDDPRQVSQELPTPRDSTGRLLLDGYDLISIVSQADVARNPPDDKIGDRGDAISKPPSNS